MFRVTSIIYLIIIYLQRSKNYLQPCTKLKLSIRKNKQITCYTFCYRHVRSVLFLLFFFSSRSWKPFKECFKTYPYPPRTLHFWLGRNWSPVPLYVMRTLGWPFIREFNCQPCERERDRRLSIPRQCLSPVTAAHCDSLLSLAVIRPCFFSPLDDSQTYNPSESTRRDTKRCNTTFFFKRFKWHVCWISNCLLFPHERTILGWKNNN